MLSFTKPLPVWAQALRRSNVVAATAVGKKPACALRTIASSSRSSQQQQLSTSSPNVRLALRRRHLSQAESNALLSELSTSSEPASAYLDLLDRAPHLLPQVPHDLIGRFFEFAVRNALPSFLGLLVSNLATPPGPGKDSLGAPPGHQRRRAALKGLMRGAASMRLYQPKPGMTKLEQEASGAGLFEASRTNREASLRLVKLFSSDLLARTFSVLLEPEAEFARPLQLPEELSYAQARACAREIAATHDARLAGLMGALLEHVARPFTSAAQHEPIERRWLTRNFPAIEEGARLMHYYLSLPARTRTGVYEMAPSLSDKPGEHDDELPPQQVAVKLLEVMSLDRESSVGLALATATKDGIEMRKCLAKAYNLAVRLDSSAELDELTLKHRLDQAVFETTVLSLCARLFARPPEPQFAEAATALLDIDALQGVDDPVPRFVTVQARQLVLRAMVNNQHTTAMQLCTRLARLLVSTQPKAEGEKLEQYDYEPGQSAVLLEARWLEELFDQYAATAPDTLPALLLPLIDACAPGALALHLGSPLRVVEAFEKLEEWHRPARRSEIPTHRIKVGVALGFWSTPPDPNAATLGKAERLRSMEQREQLQRKLDAQYDEGERARIVAWAARGGAKKQAKELYKRWAGEGPVCKSWKGDKVHEPPLHYEAPGVVQSSAVLGALVKLFSADHTAMRRRDERTEGLPGSSGKLTPASVRLTPKSAPDEQGQQDAPPANALVPLNIHERRFVAPPQRTRAHEDMEFARYVVGRFRGARAMPDHTHHSLTSLAHACFRINEAPEAFVAFAQLLLRRVVPDSYDIAILLNGMAEHDLERTTATFLRHIKTGPSWLSKNSRTGIEPTEAQYTVLLAQCIQQGRQDLGTTLLESAKQQGLSETLAIRAPTLLLRVLAEDQKSTRPSGVLPAVRRLLREGWKPEAHHLNWLAHRAATRPSKAPTAPSGSAAQPRRAVAGDEALAATHLLMLSVSTARAPRLAMRATRDVVQALHNQAAYICLKTRSGASGTGGKWNAAGRDKRLQATRQAADRVVRLLRWTEELRYDEDATLRRAGEPNVLEYAMFRSLVYLYLRARDAVGALEVLAYMRDVGLDLGPDEPEQSAFYAHFTKALDQLAEGDAAKRKEWRARLDREADGPRTKEWWREDAPAPDMPDEEADEAEWDGE